MFVAATPKGNPSAFDELSRGIEPLFEFLDVDRAHLSRKSTSARTPGTSRVRQYLAGQIHADFKAIFADHSFFGPWRPALELAVGRGRNLAHCAIGRFVTIVTTVRARSTRTPAEIKAGEIKAKCLELTDVVAKTGTRPGM